MKTADGRGRLILGLSCASALLFALVLAALAVVSERQTRAAFLQGARIEAQARLDRIRPGLQAAVDSHVQLASGLAAVLGYDPSMDQAGLSRLRSRLPDDGTAVRSVKIAPDFVVRLVHPPEADQAALGTSVIASGSRSTTFEGPTELSQGGAGYVVRAPAFGDGADAKHASGLVAVELDAQALFRAGGLASPDLGLDVALVGDANGGPAAGEVVFGDPRVLDRDPIQATVVLPGGSWTLAATPAGGWPTPPAPWGLRGLFALAALLMAGPILGTARFVASGQAKLAMIRDREAELTRLSWRLEFALAASNVGVWDVDLGSDELLWDARAQELFGCADRVGPFGEADWVRVLHPDDRERALTEAAAAIAGDGKFVSEYRIVRPDGEVRRIRDMAAVFHDADGHSRLVGLIWDITADVERQEELNLRRLEAEAATVAKSRFLATMSHEIRTPMNGVLALLGMITDEPLSPTQRERVEIALTSARSLLDILNDILDFSKLEANQTRVRAQVVILRTLLRDVVDLMAADATHRGLALTLDVAPAVPDAVLADPLLLRQVLTNLLSNAAKFTPAGGNAAVIVSYAPDEAGGLLRVEVRDTGIGIEADACERIFEDFVQADDSLSRRAGGTGLGLAISRRLVELMGGTITVHSRPGEGSAFRFEVPAPTAAAPRAAANGLAAAPASQPAASAAVAAAAGWPLRVLVAEDNATNRYVIEAYLKKDGHSIVMVECGQDAIDAVQTQPFDVVLMDMQMPRVDGLSATRAIRALPGPVSTVPIIALTANAMAGDRELCLDAGMDDYLAKPIDRDGLRAMLSCFSGSRPGRSVATG